MINLGEKNENKMYPSMQDEKETKVNFRTISLPLKILGSLRPKLGDDIVVEVRGIVTGMTENKYYDSVEVEVHEGEVESEEQEKEEKGEKKENKSLLG